MTTTWTVLLIAFFFLLVTGAFAQSTIGGNPPCSVCGDGRVITKPDGLVIAEKGETYNCQLYQDYGEEGFFEPDICEFAYIYTGGCGCRKKRNVFLIVGLVLLVSAFLAIVAMVYYKHFHQGKNSSTAPGNNNTAMTTTTTTVDHRHAAGGNQIEMVNAQPIPAQAVAYGGEVFEFFVPQGKLGVVIDKAPDGIPVVSAVSEKSIISERVKAGDKILAIDDENVQNMTVAQVSELLSKSDRDKRKLMMLRTGSEA